MDIFQLHQTIVGDYRNYIASFLRIADGHIGQTVQNALDGGELWPEPLLQLNPPFADAGSIDAVLSGSCAAAFDGFRLFEHQRKAMILGLADSDFVVVSGTGSGK
jgi:ATP-dependent helicase YprA (DUF1998 family)